MPLVTQHASFFPFCYQKSERKYEKKIGLCKFNYYVILDNI